ncbi:MAG: DUF4276 family protein [Burkholderiaceae bacterium]|nr:DUF4276 family protein [Burkholderiaceae bacterium]
MKIGLILECALEGPDQQVYSAWLRRLVPQAQIEPSCAGNKKRLVAEAGLRAKSLFDEGCERVLIIWDLWPAWASKGARPDVGADIAAIEASLRAAGVADPCVYLVCVDRMLQTLLIVDANAIRSVLNAQGPLPGLRHYRNPRNQPAPKNYLDARFRAAKRGAYTPHVHARQIAERIDFVRLRRDCPEFERIEQSASQVPCAPPLAWQH